MTESLELQEAELGRARLAVLVERLPLAVVVVDADSGRTALANRQARDLFFEGHDAVTSRFDEPALLARDEVVPLEDRPLTRALRRGEVTTAGRFEYGRADGRLVALEISALPLRDPGARIVAAILMAQDVTDRERRERAEREFLSNAAHQLRTPVAAIQSAIDVLEGGAKNDLPARDRFLGHISHAAARLSRLSQSLLVLSRAQSGERPRAELVEVSPLLREVAGSAYADAEVTVTVRCRRDLVVLTNRDLLHEALASLVDNAARYTRRGRISLRGRRDGSTKIEIEVADTGSGMTPEVQARMFERFFGGGAGGGFGLGLAIAAQAAEAMGAEIDVDSEPGSGTSVRLRLPAGKLRTT